MPRQSHQAVEIPGVTSHSSAELEGQAPDDDTEGMLVDDPLAEIARLRAQLAAKDVEIEQARAASGRVLSSAVFEPDTPHGLVAKALSNHAHLTSKELTRLVAAGEVKVEQRHVLCADGWWVNPKFS